MTTAGGAVCTIAEWDSRFFGRRIARLHADRPSADDVVRAAAWADGEGVDCLYALVDADARSSVRALETQRFHLADVRLTLARPTGVPEPAGRWRVEDATTADAPALQAMARASHTGTRFTDDPGFDRGRAAELYAVWIANALVEPDASVLVCRGPDAVAGYLSVHAQSRPEATIGLVAVSETSRNGGIGQALVHEARRRALVRGAATVSVVTQGRNAASVRFYERCGFQARRCQLWYHRWAAG